MLRKTPPKRRNTSEAVWRTLAKGVHLWLIDGRQRQSGKNPQRQSVAAFSGDFLRFPNGQRRQSAARGRKNRARLWVA